MSKDYYTSDGRRYTVNDMGQVYGPNGAEGQMNTFGDFVSSGSGESYRINNYGQIIGQDGSYKGQIYNGNHVVANEHKNVSTSPAANLDYTTIDFFAKLKRLALIILLIMALGTYMLSLLYVLSLFFSTLGEHIGLSKEVSIVFAIIADALTIALLVLIIKKIRKKLKNRKK